MTDLVLFTAEYPYGVASETFLESEVPVLARRFSRVVILPSAVVSGSRVVPGNVEVVAMPWVHGPSAVARLSSVLSKQMSAVLTSTFTAPLDVLRCRRTVRMGADILTRNIDKYRMLMDWVLDQGLADAVFYDYWFENSTVALALLRKFGHIRTAIARAHNFDVYDNEANGLTVPFRRFKATTLDAVAPTSAAAAKHLGVRVPEARDRFHVHVLGVPDPGEVVASAGPSTVPLIVTCGSFAPYKRMELVPQVLASLDRPFRWVHIGDGPQRGAVERSAERTLKRDSWQFLGQLRNRDVLEFYRSQPVAVLLSVSAWEGLPVSMMEAQSFGIPIVATDVGGVREIVNCRTGVLVPADATARAMADALRGALAPSAFDRRCVRSYWLSAFEADRNYERFVDFLLTVHERRLSTGRS